MVGKSEQETLQKMQNIFNKFEIETERGRGRVHVKKN